MFFLLALVFLLSISNAFVMDNRISEVSKDIKSFTFVKAIKDNDCTCACQCAAPNEQNSIGAPPAPNKSFENQFKLVKIVRNRVCDCSCSCTTLKSTRVFETQPNEARVASATNTTLRLTTSLSQSPPTSTTQKPQLTSATQRPIRTVRPKKKTIIVLTTTPSTVKPEETTLDDTSVTEESNHLGAFVVAVESTTLTPDLISSTLESTEAPTTVKSTEPPTTELTTKQILTTTIQAPTTKTTETPSTSIDLSTDESNNEAQEMGRKQLIAEKQRQLQQAQNWQNFLIERANARQRAMNNAVAKPDAEQASENRKPPFNCNSIRQFARSFEITDPTAWIEKNCESLKTNFPNASCNQIVRIFLSCFV